MKTRLSKSQPYILPRFITPVLAVSIFIGLFFFILFSNNNIFFQYNILQTSDLKLNFSIGIDHLGRVMGLFILTIASMIYLYAYTYMKSEIRRSVFLFQFLLVVLSAILLSISQNLVTAFIAWQLIGINLYLLLNYYHDDPNANKSAKKKFVINRIGDCTFLTAIIIAIHTQNSTDFNALIHAKNSGLVATLLFISVLTKCAQFPFHIWLLDTMEAPTPVSALMHAGIINSGGILLTRVSQSIMENHILLAFMITISLLTISLTSYWKIRQPDIKKQLAYSTSGQMGYMIAQCSVGAFPAAIFHLITHGFFKASLFLNAGQTINKQKANTKKYSSTTLIKKIFATLITASLLTLFGISINLSLPILIIGFILITLYSSINIAYSNHFGIKVELILTATITAFTALYLLLLKIFSSYLHQYEYPTNTIPSEYQILAIIAIGAFWFFTKNHTKKHISIADNTELYLRKYLLNPTRSLGEFISTALDQNVFLKITLITTTSLLILSLAINIGIIHSSYTINKWLTLILLTTNIFVLLAANRAHSIKKLAAMLILYQTIFITYALLHQSELINKIIAYHIVNISVVSLLLFMITKNISDNPKYYLTTALLLLIGIPGTASFISEIYLLNAMCQLGPLFASLYLLGIMLLSITIMHALQLYSYGIQGKSRLTHRIRMSRYIFWLMIIMNIFFGIFPNTLLSIL